ncbi:nicotinate N-methyltransferase 1 [Triticum aestivum]|uniref:nicotinate N-methyltransferase 1 n=1 Tax=Triticum aestivum TaxID=4565 RepID=UPI001D02988B|nr:nicotinate N-methyltransferase 1-like [Triticum aestivum]
MSSPQPPAAEPATPTAAEMSPPEARLAMMELANMIAVPMALTAVIRLGVPAAVWAGGANAPLSAAELLPPGHPDPSVLERLLRLLASRGVFSEHAADGRPERRYALTAVGRTLVPSGASGASYADYVLQHHQDALVLAWPRLHEAVLDPAGPEPFARAHAGVPAYAYYGQDRDANEVMLRAMTGVSEPFMEALLDGYEGGFEGVATLVDVGGSSGACLEMIMRRVPTIREGVNFDLPDVVAAAPTIAGVKHVGGDMFKSIPSGDAIFMKWVLTTWTNDECTAILKKCHEALPEGGKLIACEPVVPETTDASTRTRALLENDIFVMTTYRTQGRERSEEEFRQLGLTAGFAGFRALYLDPFYAVLEYVK